MIFSLSDQFIEDFSCNFEGDFNILVTFFLGPNFLGGFTCRK